MADLSILTIPIIISVIVAILRYEHTHHEPRSGQDGDYSDWRL